MIVLTWASGVVVRLRRIVVEALQSQNGNAVDTKIVGSGSLKIGEAATRRQVLKRLHAYRGRLPAGFAFDRLEANARE